jgi:hypothetical protein
VGGGGNPLKIHLPYPLKIILYLFICLFEQTKEGGYIGIELLPTQRNRDDEESRGKLWKCKKKREKFLEINNQRRQ